MVIYAGIDEAGYGPLLGPLAIAATAFPLHEAASRVPDLWARLPSIVARERRAARGRITIADSKRLKGARGSARPLAALERGVLAFLGPPVPPTDAALLERVGAGLPPLPWYADPVPLPVDGDAGLLGIDAARTHLACLRELAGAPVLLAELIDAGEFNDRVARTDNKSEAVFAAVIRLVERIRRRWPEAELRIVCDRQGGRRDHRRELAWAIEDASIRVLSEGDRMSAYRVETPHACPLQIAFLTEAEDAHLPVALASMTAKYLRELAMTRLNRFFTARQPALQPTAGYVEDGRRFLADITPVLRTLAVDPEVLVRSR